MSRPTWTTCGLIAGILLSAPARGAHNAPSPHLVTTQWLGEHLADSGLRIIDMRYGVNFYWQKHIPGAVFLHPDALRLPDGGVPEKPMPPEIFAQVLGRAGISCSTTAVVYAEAADSLSPYLIWQLECLGHDRSAVLSGGLDKWQAEGRPVTQAYPVIEPVEYVLSGRPSSTSLATKEDVMRAAGERGAVLLDVRTPAQYLGAKGWWARNGRIPGAVNRYWTEDLLEGGTPKDSATLSRDYAAIGVTPDRRVIVYCARGYRSANTWFVLKHVLGFPDVRVYDGGFSEWSSIPSLPVETGSPKKR